MAVISKDLGAVTAYAAAVNRGYTGTKEEFETLMASYATVAQQAAESASNASQSATNASQSATDAETAKGTAQQAATDAQTAQASAQESAQSAQQSAQSASQSAQDAESAKQTAVSTVDGFESHAQQALDSVNQAGNNWKSLAQAKALDSEAWALGTRGGEDVGSSDPAYHNNAKYYAESVGTSAQTATEAAQTATAKAQEAQASASAAAESARTLTIDATLTQSGQAAAADVVGNEIAQITELTTTRNLCDTESLKLKTGITYSGGVFSGKASDFSTYVLLDSGFEAGKKYTVSFYGQNTGSNVSGNGIGVRINYTNDSYVTHFLPNSTSEYVRFTAVSEARKSVASILLYYNSGGANIWNVKQIQVEEGSAPTEYIPHVIKTTCDNTARYGISTLELNALESSDIVIADKTVYSSFNDLPLNKVVLIPYSITLDDGPDGYAYIGHGTLDTGKYNATVLTFSATPTNPLQVVQICYQYRDIYDFTKQAHIATRYGMLTNDAVVWSDWSTLSQDSVLHSSNRVVDIDTYQQVTFGDFNDAPANAIYQVDLNTGTTVLNNPSPGNSGLLMTFAFSPITRHALIQHHYALENGEITMYFRYSYKNAPNDFRWTGWRKVATNISDKYIENKGKLAANTDLNTLTDNSQYLLGYNTSYINRPWETLAGFLTTKTTGLITLQTAEELTGLRKTRHSADGGSTWSEWV